MNEVNILFQPLSRFCSREVLTCSGADALVTVAGLMQSGNFSSVVVCDQDRPVGIMTDQDLRNKVVARGLDPATLTVDAIMNAPLITIGGDEFIFEALYLMTKHSIHRVVVVNEDGSLLGVLSDSDILRLQSQSAQQLLRRIEEAATCEELKVLHGQVQELIVHLVATGAATRDLVRLIAHLNDWILLRLIKLLRATRYQDLTGSFAFIALGSEGRREQTLATDQDNAIIYADDLANDEVRRLAAFANDLSEQLIAIGVPPCPGGIMAKNPEWRRSVSAWQEALDGWLVTPTPEHILTGSMFFDLRTVYGDASLEQQLKEHVAKRVLLEPMFLRCAAANVMRFQTPLGWFGRIRAEKTGVHRGQLDVKKAGIFALTEGIKVLALEAGVLASGTRERLAALAVAGVMPRSRAEDLETCFNTLVDFRMRSQIQAINAGRKPTNFIDLQSFSRTEMGRLRLALEGVGSFQEFLDLHFGLQLLR